MKKFLVLFAFVASSAQAVVEFRVADGSSSGTYAEMLKQISSMCGDTVQFVEVPSSGAVDNLDKLIGNEVMCAFMHSDVIAYRSNTEDLSNFKTLLALYQEDVHFIAMNRPYKESGWKSKLSSGKELNSINDLAGLPVGAAGGGFITANVIRLQAEIPYTVQQFDKGADVLRALADGSIAAAVFVGAAPLPNLKDLGHECKLLPIGETTVSRLKKTYHPTTITYTKISTASVTTVAADCLLVSRVYKTPRFVNALRQFRQCFTSRLDELKETPGTHKAWQQVKIENHGKWDWYNLN